MLLLWGCYNCFACWALTIASYSSYRQPRLNPDQNRSSLPITCRTSRLDIVHHAWSFRWDRKNRGPVSQQAWHDKDPSQLKGLMCRASVYYLQPFNEKYDVPYDCKNFELDVIFNQLNDHSYGIRELFLFTI